MTAEREGLADVVYALMNEFPMSDDGTGHIADCGYTFLSEKCDCYTLPQRLADLLAARDRRVRAEAVASILREVSDQTDSIGHHWSGAPALAFFALAGDLRDRADRIARGVLS